MLGSLPVAGLRGATGDGQSLPEICGSRHGKDSIGRRRCAQCDTRVVAATGRRGGGRWHDLDRRERRDRRRERSYSPDRRYAGKRNHIPHTPEEIHQQKRDLHILRARKRECRVEDERMRLVGEIAELEYSLQRQTRARMD